MTLRLGVIQNFVREIKFWNPHEKECEKPIEGGELKIHYCLLALVNFTIWCQLNFSEGAGGDH